MGLTNDSMASRVSSNTCEAIQLLAAPRAVFRARSCKNTCAVALQTSRGRQFAEYALQFVGAAANHKVDHVRRFNISFGLEPRRRNNSLRCAALFAAALRHRSGGQKPAEHDRTISAAHTPGCR